ncbi:MAG: ribosome biogenesis factor YjgA [Legionellaceae bacterium]|nr:ribosome biogenesis factor YjgA [Legionellaceae bacterium]
MDELKSKSEKKREADALQKVGIQLISWSVEKLDQLSLTDQLRIAILDAKKLKSHGAIRRQAQLIGKLMRSADYEQILAEYQDMMADDSAKTASFHEIERWRDRLMSEGKDALTAFIDEYQPEDIQQLRQLVKKAIDEHAKNQNLGAHKALFRYLRVYI